MRRASPAAAARVPADPAPSSPLPTASGDLPARLEAGASALGIDLAAAQRTRLLDYLELLSRWGRVYNLTAVREPAQMLTQHVLDSLAVWPALRRALDAAQSGPVADAGGLSGSHAPGGSSDGSGGEASGAAKDDGRDGSGATPARRLLDVGSGAGLPGAVLAIVAPDLDVTCVDAVGKKAGFVRQVAAELGLSNLHAEHARVEALRGPAGTRGFDVVASRAFASLADFVQASHRQLAPAGVWMAMKGQVPDDEIAGLPAQVEVFHVEQLAVPGLQAQRCLVWMRRRG